MEKFSETILSFEKNVKQLIKKKQEVESKLSLYEHQIVDLTQQLNQKNEEIKELEEKNKILRIAGGQKGDNREIKLKINEMIREVDKCIAQLNQ